MIKVMTAYTTEPYDVDYAVQEILTRLGKDFLANSIGLLFCNFEFLESSLARTLCGRLPFNVAGCVSQGFAVKDADETFMLTLMVLSSDDVEFVSGVSASLTAGGEGAVEALYRDLLGRGTNRREQPALMFAFPPMCTGLTGNAIVCALDRASGGVPVFGSIAVDHVVEMRAPGTIYNGEHYADRLPLVMLRGNIKPRFFARTLPGGVQIMQSAEITEAKGNRLISINNIPARTFMEKIGIGNQGMNIIYAFPLVVDSHDGSEPRLIALSKADSEGALISEQDIPRSGTVTIGAIDEKLVIESARCLVDEIKEMSVLNGLLVFSCLSRVLTLKNPVEEMTLFRREFADQPAPFLYAYSGGEICPLYKPGEARPVNGFHQFTIAACAF
jgi:hypothetical protein